VEFRISILRLGGRIAAVAAIAAVVAALLLAPGSAEARVVRMVVPVRGMTCMLCVRGVEESLKSLQGVASAAAQLSPGLVRVEALEQRSLDIRQVKDRVLRAGFGVGGECTISAVGRFSVGTEGLILFRIAGTPYVYQVLEGIHLRRLFRRSPKLQGEFAITFRLHEHPYWKPAAISIISFEPPGMVAPSAGR
jgi:copper chaperone CopZ